MGKTAFTLMIITLISKVTGLVREQFFAYFLGTGQIIDVYNTATSIPYTIFSFIISGVVATFIPIYSKIKKDKGKAHADEFTSNLVNILIFISTIIILLVFLFAPKLVSLFAPGYTGAKRELSIQFTRIISLSIYVSALSSVLIGYLQLNNRFIAAETPGIIMNFLNVFFLVLAVQLGNIYILAIGYVISELLKYSFFPKTLRTEGYTHKWIVDFKDPHIKTMITNSIPVILSIAAVDISTISDQAFASTIVNGGVSIMRYAALILQLVSGVVVVSISTSTYPSLSVYASDNNEKRFEDTLLKSNILSFILIVPAMVGIMILSEPFVRLLFQRGNFDAKSTMLTAETLVFYMPTIVGQSISFLFKKAFYARSNTKTPIIVTIVEVVTNVSLNFALHKLMGLLGLALATSISAMLGGVLSVILYKREYKTIHIKVLVVNFMKILFASLIMGFVTYNTYKALVGIHYLLALAGSVLASIVIYLVIILFIKIPQVMHLLNSSYHKFRSR